MLTPYDKEVLIERLDEVCNRETDRFECPEFNITRLHSGSIAIALFQNKFDLEPDKQDIITTKERPGDTYTSGVGWPD